MLCLFLARLLAAAVCFSSLVRCLDLRTALDLKSDHILTYNICLPGARSPQGSTAAAGKVVLKGRGAHRELILDLQLAPGSYSYLQPLPATIYADVYQLNAAAAVHQGPRTLLHGRPDVENITQWSEPTVLAIQIQQEERSGARGSLQLGVPLHARYPVPETWTPWWEPRYYHESLQPGRLLRDVPGAGCLTLVDQERVITDGLSWDIPNGNLASSQIVDATTVAVLLLCSAYLIKTAICSG